MLPSTNFGPLGHFYAPEVPCFPVAPVAPGEGKRPMVMFSHGLGGNRAVYAEHGAAYAAQVSAHARRWKHPAAETKDKHSMIDGRVGLPWYCSGPFFGWAVFSRGCVVCNLQFRGGDTLIVAIGWLLRGQLLLPFCRTRSPPPIISLFDMFDHVSGSCPALLTILLLLLSYIRRSKR